MKIHWSIRTIAFIASVFTLSIFFAGWRELTEHGHIAYGAFVLTSGVLLTGLLLALQGYWIYFEEKQKGTLRRHIGWYESLHNLLEAHCASNKAVRLIQPAVTIEKGNSKQ
jgi:hypothetical protein